MTHLPGVSGPARAAVSAALVLLLLLTGCSGGGEKAEQADSPSSDRSSEAGPDEPGRLLSSEPYDGGAGAGVEAWRVRYRTTDARGEPREGTGLVVAPANPGDRGAVAAVAHPTVGMAQDCAPSGPDRAQATVASLSTLAERGWVVVAPDYAGLGTPGGHDYLVGRAAAHDVLDAVRSGRELVPEADEETVLWGHSQGGHAVLWAGAEASSYAPELEVSGVAATGVPTRLREVVRRLEDTSTAALVSAFVVAAWDREYPRAGILEQVPEASRPMVEKAAAGCLGGDEFASMYQLAKGLKGQLLPEEAYDGRFGELLDRNSPTGRMEAPLFVGQSTQDAVVPRDVTRDWVSGVCEAGGEVRYREYPGGHSSVVASPATVNELLTWMDDRVAGKPFEDDCG